MEFDSLFSDSIGRIAKEFGYDVPGSTFTPDNIAKLIRQETTSGGNEPPNKYGYAGYFQMKPKEFGLTPDDFAKMSFEDQLRLYAGSYLPKYKYTGTEDLGVMNAAPAYANKPDDFVAYRAGSPEAEANPQWRKYSNAGGAVTVGGIKAWLQAGQPVQPQIAASQLPATPTPALPTPQAPTAPGGLLGTGQPQTGLLAGYNPMGQLSAGDANGNATRGLLGEIQAPSVPAFMQNPVDTQRLARLLLRAPPSLKSLVLRG